MTRVSSTHWENEEIHIWKQVGKAETHSWHTLHPWHSDVWLWGKPQFPASFWGAEFGFTFSASRLSSHCKDGSLQHQSLKAHGPRLCKIWRTVVSKEAVLNRYASTPCDYPPRAQGREEQSETPVFPWKRFECIVYELLLEDPASNFDTSRSCCNSLREGTQWTFPCLFPLAHSNSNTKLLVWLSKHLVS